MGATISHAKDELCSCWLYQGGSELHRAARLGQVARVEYLLREADAHTYLEEHGRYGWTPLMEAVGMGQRGTATCLLDAGADIEARGSENQTALHEAAENGSVRLVSMLLERGADVEAVSSGWMTRAARA